MWHTIVKMEFIKEEIEDVNISETFIVKNEDAEDDTGWFITGLFVICFLMLAFKQINDAFKKKVTII